MMKYIKWVLVIGILLASCNESVEKEPVPTPASTGTAEKTNDQLVEKTAAPTSTFVDVTQTVLPVPAISPKCNIGLGLRAETIDILLEYKKQISFIMTANVSLAEQYFEQFDGSTRVIAAPSLAEINNKGLRASDNNVPYEALGYGLETSISTPSEEWHDLVGSTKSAKNLALEFDKLLVMGPGFKLLSNNEDQYGPMGAITDIWMFQTQQLQKEPPGAEYRQEVERIIQLIKSENPDIEIWAQITLPPDRDPDAEEWLAYRQNINDLVDGTYIGVYTWDITNQDQLVDTIQLIIETACSDS